MFNAVTKTSFTVAAFSLVAAIATWIAVGDRVGFSVLFWVVAAATAAGLASFWLTPRDPIVPASAEVDAASSRTVDITDLPKGSPWPLVAALAVGLLAVGAALGTSMIVMGSIVGVVAAACWLGQVWTEHPSWSQEMTDRINERFIVPIGLPGTIVVLGGIGVLSFSRIFLTVSAEAAPFIAAAVAFAVLGVIWLISTREDVGRTVLVTLVGLSAVLVVGSGVASALRGEREFHSAGEHGEAVVLTATELAFDTAEMHFPAESEVVVELVNDDVAPHNWALYETKGGEPIYQGDTIDAGSEASYEFESPEVGTYYFQCDLHPTMNGSVVVAEAEEPEAGESTTSTTEA